MRTFPFESSISAYSFTNSLLTPSGKLRAMTESCNSYFVPLIETTDSSVSDKTEK